LRTTIFNLVNGRVEFQVSEVPPWGDTDEFGGAVADLHHMPNGACLLHRIPAGTSVPIHTGPDYGFCQIVTGRGKLVLPTGQEINYHGPELYFFEPGTLHGWRDVATDTLLSVCQVKDSGAEAV